MAYTSLQDRVTALVSRPTVADRVGGVVTSDLEGAAVLDLVAVSLYRNPRAVFYLIHLARNGLLTAIAQELLQLDSLLLAVSDLSNPVKVLRSADALEKVRTMLLRLEGSGQVNPDNHLFSQLHTSISDVLNKDLGPSVRRNGSLVRPSDEALSDLTAGFAALKTLHEDLLDRLNSLPVGADNFLASPIPKTKGVLTATRFRGTVEAAIDEIVVNGETPASRDLALALLAGRSSLRHVGKAAAAADPVLSTEDLLPEGCEVSGESDPAAAEISLGAGPFTLPPGAQLTLADGATSIGPVYLPQPGSNISGRPFVVGGRVSFPVTVPSGSYLLLLVDGTLKKVNLGSGAQTLAQTLTSLRAVTGLNADEFGAAGSGRLIIWATSGARLQLVSSATAGSGSTLAALTGSAHSLLGFQGTEDSTGKVPAQTLADAIGLKFPTIVSSSARRDGTVRLTGLRTVPGAYLQATAPSALGGSQKVYAVSDTIRLLGKVRGASVDPVPPATLLSVGQVLEKGDSAAITWVGPTRFRVETPLPTFSGSIVVRSLLPARHAALVTALKQYLVGWSKSGFQADLSVLDAAVSACISTQSPAQQGDLRVKLQDLRSRLVSLQGVLTSAAASFPNSPAEREAVNSVLGALEERGFDRAVDQLLRGRILEGCTSTPEEASHSGYLQAAMALVAKNDMKFPNRAMDEGLETESAGS